MHSSLRRELCGTPKVLQSVRTRSTSRPRSAARKFSNRTYLLSQPSSQDDSSRPPGNRPSPSNDHSGLPSNLTPRAYEIAADLEKWIQNTSDQGQEPEGKKTAYVEDENGRRRLSPFVIEVLSKMTQDENEGNKKTQSPAFKVQNESRREAELDTAAENRVKNVALRSHREHSSEIDKPDLKSDTPRDVNSEQKLPANEQIPLQDLPTSPREVASQSLDNNNLGFKFHGSSAARRQRERQSRIREKSPVVVLPDWFNESNVHVWDDPESQVSALGETMDLWPKDLDGQPIRILSQAHSEASEVSNEIGEDKAGDNTVTEKIQTHGAGSDDPLPSTDADGSTTLPDSESMSVVALSPPENRYHIHSAQLLELLATTKGRLKLPADGSPSNRLGSIRSHLLVHYLALDGDLFLDRLIQDVARILNCNLISLDAQDISALISKADIDPMLADEAKMLSYELYGGVYKEGIREDEHSPIDPDDMEDMDENGVSGMPQGIPFIVGKPITIDLKGLFGPRNSRRNNNSFLPKNLMPELIGRASMSKPVPHIFQSIVESILSSANSKKRSTDNETTTQDRSELSQKITPLLNQNSTIVHVKDLKAIQETNIGKIFLAQLYDQVERRRGFGEPIMLIGTSCDRGSKTYYDVDKIRDRIRAMQVSEPDEMSSTIVITPAYSTLRKYNLKTAEETLAEIQRVNIPEQDREIRLKIINGRHLCEMLQSKGVSLDYLQDGFWTRKDFRDFSKYNCLGKSFWSFSYIQRIAAILATGDYSGLADPVFTASKVLEYSDELKYDWVKKEQPKNTRGTKATEEGTHDQPKDKLSRIRAAATKHEKKLLSGVIEPNNIRTTFNDIHIPADTVEALQTLTTLSLVRPDAFKYGVLSSDRIPGLLLYGPPGTGKTLAAKAVARESGATMLEVSAADINDMYVGEGEKNVKALFSLAKKLSPCVVFLDEADAMFSSRRNDMRRASHRELLNQFLKEWDGMSNDSGSAFIMVATNRPMDLDDAVLRRLPRRLLVDLPTEKDRLEILKIHLRHEQLAEDVDLAKLAASTQFYSGSDLKNVAVAAALECVREENKLAKEHMGEDPYQYPKKRTLTSTHFDRALQDISASISEDMASLKDIKKFDEQYGDRKGRRKRSAKWGFKTAAEADAVLDTVKVRS